MPNKTRAKHYINEDSSRLEQRRAHWDARTAKEPNHDDECFRNADRIDDTAPAAANVQLPRGAELVPGSGWYHDEAIQAENARKN
jgi:hypothetical protein